MPSSDLPPAEHPTDPAAAPSSSPNVSRVPLAPRVNPPSINNPPAQSAPEAGRPFDLNDLVNLAKNLSAAAPAQSASAGRTLIPKEQKKFSRRENKPREESGVTEAPEPEETASNRDEIHGASAESAAPARARSSAAAKQRPPTVPLTATRHTRRGIKFPLIPFLIAEIAILLAVFFAWLTWRAAPPAQNHSTAGNPSVASNAESETPVSAAAFDLVDQMAAAEKAGNLPKALALCEQIRAADHRVPHLDYKQAQLAMSMGDSNQAMLALNRAMADGADLSESHILRAALLIQQNKISPAAREYELSAQAAPFTAKPFFYWGECLRRLGKPQTALVRLNQALDRARDPGEEALYRLKMRLTLIELNREQEFAEELKTELAREHPTPEWLLTAAAQEMHRGAFDAAAGHLDQVANIVPPAMMSIWLRDYFIFGFAQAKELNRFYAPLLPPAPAAKPSPAADGNGTPSGKAEEAPDTLPKAAMSGQDVISPVAPAILPGAPAAASPTPPPLRKK